MAETDDMVMAPPPVPLRRGRKRRRKPDDDGANTDDNAAHLGLLGCLVGSQQQRRRWRWLCLPLLLAAGGVDAGVTDIQWHNGPWEHVTDLTIDSGGNVVVCGCVAAMSYVTKYARSGEALWHDALDDHSCATAIGSDQDSNVYVTGASSTATDKAVFLIKYGANGKRKWTKTFGTGQTDQSLTLRIVSELGASWSGHPSVGATSSPAGIYVGGYSSGNMSLTSFADGKKTTDTAKCQAPSTNPRLCEDGFVVKLTLDGHAQWVHQISSTQSDRVYGVDVDVTTGHVLVVGETYGYLHDLGWSGSSTNLNASHAGDLVVRKMDAATGQVMWTRQLRSSSASVADLCYFQTSVDRGKCSITAATDAVYVTGSTAGLITTSSPEIMQYQRVCKADGTQSCVQALVARLDPNTGDVMWVRQFVSASFTTAERIVEVPHLQTVVVLTTADSGVFSSDKFEQLVLWAITDGGDTAWMSELGLDGTDHGASMQLQSEPTLSSLLVGGYGSVQLQASGMDALSYLRRVDMSTGSQIPLCTDTISFFANMTVVHVAQPSSPSDRVVVVVPVVRANEHCGSGYATYRTIEVSNATRYGANMTPAVIARDYVQSSGALQFLANEKYGEIAVEILPMSEAEKELLRSVMTNETPDRIEYRVFSIILESALVDTVVFDPRTMAVAVDVLLTRAAIFGIENVANHTNSSETITTTTTIVAKTPDVPGVGADGHFWQRLSRIVALVLGSVLTAVIVIGRCCAGCLRRGKVFEYKMVRFSPKHSTHSSFLDLGDSHDTEETDHMVADDVHMNPDDDTAELQAHLEDIQSLNESLEHLVQTAALRKATKPQDSEAGLLELLDEETNESTALAATSPRSGKQTPTRFSAASLFRKKSRKLKN